jgi:hypothetical protein
VRNRFERFNAEAVPIRPLRNGKAHGEGGT